MKEQSKWSMWFDHDLKMKTGQVQREYEVEGIKAKHIDLRVQQNPQMTRPHDMYY